MHLSHGENTENQPVMAATSRHETGPRIPYLSALWGFMRDIYEIAPQNNRGRTFLESLQLCALPGFPRTPEIALLIGHVQYPKGKRPQV